MDDKVILTIGRQFGSGGREIGQKLAKALDIAYYDKELMALAAKESGLSEEFFQRPVVPVPERRHPQLGGERLVYHCRTLCRLYLA